MRAASICILVALLAVGCDPAGLRRVQLQLTSGPALSGSISVDSPAVQEALKIVDTVVTQHGFQVTTNYSHQNKHGYIRLYSMDAPAQQPATIPCYVWLTSTGVRVEFGEFSFAYTYHAADAAFNDTSAALIKRYGKKNVRSHVYMPDKGS
jgi:hypothetical protein